MTMNYFSAAEYNGYRIKIRSQLIGKILLNIKFTCAPALFYAARRPYLLTKSGLSINAPLHTLATC